MRLSNLTPLNVFVRGYKSRTLSKRVAQPGKGKTVVAGRKPARPSRFLPKSAPAPTQPTTLDMGKFASLKGVPAVERKTHRNLLEKVTDFGQLRISSEIRDNMLGNLLQETSVPTPVQKVAIKSLRAQRKNEFGFKSWLLAAETGSGKTLAYLLPILSQLSESPQDVKEAPQVRSIVLVPTLELVSQVASQASAIAPNLRILPVDVNSRASRLAKRITKGADLIIATPDKINALAEHEPVLAERALADCRYVVVDEADSLMNESFSSTTLKVLKRCPQLIDAIFVTATIPSHFDKVLREAFPETIRLVTPSIHRLPRHIEFRVIEVFRPPYRDNKELALQQALYSIYHDNAEPNLQKRVMVFVNKKASVKPLVNMLNSAGYPTVGLDGTLPPNERAELLEAFVNPPKERTSDKDKLHVMVATDLVARGIDMKKIRNVILYDLPWSAADLLHRAGRTGRLNAGGRVLLFVSRTEAKGWVKGLEKIVKRGQALA